MYKGKIDRAMLAANGQRIRWEAETLAAPVWSTLAAGMIAAARAANVNPAFTKGKSIFIFR